MANKKTDKKLNTKTIAAGVIAGVILVGFVATAIVGSIFWKAPDDPAQPTSPSEQGYTTAVGMQASVADSYEDVLGAIGGVDARIILVDPDSHVQQVDLDELDFDNEKYLMVSYKIDSCWESIIQRRAERYPLTTTWRVYYDLQTYCYKCDNEVWYVDLFEVESINDNDTIDVYTKIDDASSYCMVEDKPIIYIHPTKEMDLTVKLGRPDLLTSTYPKYQDGWTVHATPDGNLYDYATGRNYYVLYWEGVNDDPVDFDEGFVVAGADTVEFLEEKLAILGLNEYETEEFITYWIARMEANPYNLIRFRTTAEMNAHMPIEFSTQPDTLIRIMMDYKALDAPIEVPEQVLEPAEREGFTVVEWGGSEIK